MRNLNELKIIRKKGLKGKNKCKTSHFLGGKSLLEMPHALSKFTCTMRLDIWWGGGLGQTTVGANGGPRLVR